jgi:hypothetical protein
MSSSPDKPHTTSSFLIAVPVKSFDSGHSNRDLHMIQAMRGAEFPANVIGQRALLQHPAEVTQAQPKGKNQWSDYSQANIGTGRKAS